MIRKSAILFCLAAVLYSAPAGAQEKPKSGEITRVVGLLVEQFTETCPKPFEVEWTAPHFEVGFVRVEPADKVELKPLVGKPVVITGRAPKKAGSSRPEFAGASCLPQQARSDWVFNKTGIRLLRRFPEGATWVSHFVAAKVEGFDGVRVTREGDTLAVTFVNTLDVTLPAMAVILHYDGCYGKPSTDTRVQKLGGMTPGHKAAVEFPTLVEETRRKVGGKHGKPVLAATSVQITTESKEVVFDLDLSLSSFEGGGVECPKDPPRQKPSPKATPE